MSNNDKLSSVIEKVVDSKIEKAMARGQSKSDTGEYLGRDSTGKEWIRLNGAVETTPVKRSMVEVAKGDIVSVTIGNGFATIDSNISNPAAGLKGTTKTRKIAESAKKDAKNAIDYASQAQTAANIAKENSETAQKEASNATAAAEIAHREADSAQESANVAKEAADSAVADARVANVAATEAKADAKVAHAAADKALVNLSVIEDVAGTLDWIQQHGEYIHAEDRTVQEGTVYFTYDSETQDYIPIVNPDPDSDPYAQGWFVLDLTASTTEYIMAHLAVTSRGLWVLPSGINTGTVVPDPDEDGTDSHAEENARARLGSDYKVLLSSDGMYIYDGDGLQTALYSPDGIVYAEGKSFHIGNNDAYILYTPASGQNPASITIGGSNIQLGSAKTLSELIEQVDSTYRFEVEETYVYDESTPPKAVSVTLAPHLYLGDTEVTTNFPASYYTYGIKHETEVDPVPLNPGYGYTHSVLLSEAGYGATIVCKFSEPNDAELLTSDDDTLDDSDDNPLSVRVASGDHVRVSDLTVATTVFGSDRVMIVGSEDEHLVTIDTLKDVFGDGDYERLDNMPSIEDVTLSGNKTFPDLGIFKTDAQGYSVADQYTLTTLDINSLWANAQPIGG